MVKKKLLPLGELVVSKKNNKLFLWPSSYADDLMEQCDIAESNEVMLILEVKCPTNEDIMNIFQFNSEWKDGAYLVMKSNGSKGWVGSGWVKSATRG